MLHNSANLIKYMDRITRNDEDPEDPYYNPMNIISYQRPLNIVTGTRSIGKSTNMGAYTILDFLINERLYMYLRRTDPETRKTWKEFFKNSETIINEKAGLPYKISLSVGNNAEYFVHVDGVEGEKKRIGIAANLKNEQSYKSGNLSGIHNIIYDEFISKDPNAYLGTRMTPEVEYDNLISLFQTIDRDIGQRYRQDTRLFLMGNTATIYNPIYLSLNLPRYIVPGARFIRPKNKLWILEQSPMIPKDAENSWIAQLSSKKNYEYAINNIGDDGGDEWIRKFNYSSMNYIMTIIMGGEKYAIRTEQHSDNIQISRNIKDSKNVYSLDPKSHNGNDLELINNMRTSWQGKAIITAYLKGKLWFSDKVTRQTWIRYLTFTNTKYKI